MCLDSSIKEDITSNINSILSEGVISVKVGKEITEKVKKKFIYEDKHFPILEGENKTCKLINLFDKEYYLGVYDRYRVERDGIYEEESFKDHPGLCKVELIETYNCKSLFVEEDCVIPIVCLENNTLIKFKNKKYSTNINQKNKGRYYYYNIEKGTKVYSKDKLIFGKPIRAQKKGLKKLVLNIFVDGLSQSFLENKGLEKIMPNTYKYFKKGVICENTYVSGEWTLVGMASYFTGKYTATHNIFHPVYNTPLPSNNKIYSEYFSEGGYYTAKIDGDWRSTPNTGYARGINRFLYQSAIRGMNVEEIVCETIEHLSGFSNQNNFAWIGISDLHDISDGFELSLSSQTKLHINSRVIKEEEGCTSVRRTYDCNKEVLYENQIKKVDMYLGFLFDFIEGNYNEDEVVISLISDHGQGYLVKEEDEFLSDMRTKVPMMFRGSGFSKGEKCQELMQGLDLMGVVLNELQMNIEEGLDSVVPRFFGGEKGRDYVYSESIFPGSTYKASIKNNKYDFYFESEHNCGEDGSVDFGNYRYKFINKETSINEEEEHQKCINIVKNHLKYYVKY
ncbi:MAG: sulfatase-like hydrolase/transferase [Clostridium sp.]